MGWWFYFEVGGGDTPTPHAVFKLVWIFCTQRCWESKNLVFNSFHNLPSFSCTPDGGDTLTLNAVINLPPSHTCILLPLCPCTLLPSHPPALHPCSWAWCLTTLCRVPFCFCALVVGMMCHGITQSLISFSPLCPHIPVSRYKASHPFILVPLYLGMRLYTLTLLHPHALVPSHLLLLCPHTSSLCLCTFTPLDPSIRPCIILPFTWVQGLMPLYPHTLFSDIWACHHLFLTDIFSSFYVYRDKTSGKWYTCRSPWVIRCSSVAVVHISCWQI